MLMNSNSSMPGEVEQCRNGQRYTCAGGMNFQEAKTYDSIGISVRIKIFFHSDQFFETFPY